MNNLSRSGFFELLGGKASFSAGNLNERTNDGPVNTLAEAERTSKSGLAPYTGTWGREQILHLVRRTMFGVTHDDIEFFSKLTLSQSLDVLLKQSPGPAPPVNAYNDNLYKDPDVPFAETWVFCATYDTKCIEKRLKSLYAWWIGLMLNQDRSLSQKMALFWSNHLACELQNTFDARPSYGYLALLMKHSLGNFKELMFDITTCPAMLQYLSGNESTAEAPNENYSREMQELFTVGKGPHSHYTQDDVNAAARILTGWTTTPNGLTALYNAAVHDSGDKHFSSFYNNTVIKGRTGKAGADETKELLDMIFGVRETAMHTCRCLYRWFVYSAIDDNIETNIIGPLADILIKHNFEIAPVLSALLGSEHFFDTANIGCHIKNPVDYLIGLCRQFKVNSFPGDLTKQYNAWYTLAATLKRLSMGPGEPPNVAGWPAYYLSPGYYQIWINSDSLVQRCCAIDQLLDEFGLESNDSTVLKFDILAFTTLCSNPSDLLQLTADCTSLLTPVSLDPTETSFAGNFLQYAQNDNRSWADVWAAYMTTPNDQTAKRNVTDRLKWYYNYLMKSCECHLM